MYFQTMNFLKDNIAYFEAKKIFIVEAGRLCLATNKITYY